MKPYQYYTSPHLTSPPTSYLFIDTGYWQALSSLSSDLSMWGHFLIVLNLSNHLDNALYLSSMWSDLSMWGQSLSMSTTLSSQELQLVYRLKWISAKQRKTLGIFQILAAMNNFVLLTASFLSSFSVLVVSSSSSSPCLLPDWWVTPSSFLVPAIKVSWNTSMLHCTDRGERKLDGLL